MAQMRPVLTALLLLFCHTSPSLSIPTNENRDEFFFSKRQYPPYVAETTPDPEDFSSIRSIAAIGDSYSSGIGSGNRIDWSCSRYDHSYPSLVFQDQRLENATTQYLSCSGATSPQILAKQVPVLTGGIDTLLISAGGNDALLSDILDHCIFGWRSFSYSVSSCESTLEKVSGIITNTLPGALDALITAAKAKLTPGTGRIYYTAYAQFFDQTDPQCDAVKWNFWPDPFGNAQPLDAARRTKLNGLTVDVNNAIQAAVARAGNQVVYVDYDQYYTGFTGRFCEAGVTEPAPERADLLFFERKTQDPNLLWRRQKSGFAITNVSAEINTVAAANTDNIIANNTFEGDIASRISQTLTENPTWVDSLEDDVFQELIVGPIPTDGSSPHILSATNPGNNTAIARRLRQRGIADTIAWLLPDSMKRVFHPKPNGHAYIASLVLYHMEAENAKIQASSTSSNLLTGWTEIAAAVACPLQGADLSLAAAIAAQNSSAAPTPSSIALSAVKLQPVVTPVAGSVETS